MMRFFAHFLALCALLSCPLLLSGQVVPPRAEPDMMSREPVAAAPHRPERQVLPPFSRVTPMAQRPAVVGAREATQGVMAVCSQADGGYDFYLHTPASYDPQGEPSPVVVFLHGASLCGGDMSRARRYGTLDALRRGRDIPAIIVAPHNGGGAWRPQRVMADIDWVLSHYNADADRIYIIGMSLGGYGTMDVVRAYPERFAAAMAICGGCSSDDVQPLSTVPLWILHGTADRAVSISQSKRVVTALQQAGTADLLRYDWLPGIDHGRPARLFYLRKTYDWLLRHSRATQPATIDRTISITVADLNNAYEGLHR